MAAEASRSGGPSVDSYIGSLISLTSKSEIRYEGVLYNINTDESSIGLRNVRSFGTEGRKKDGPQISAIEKIYEYILFRGSDIKDLQVKSSPPVQSTAVYEDPAIIQSHYPRPVSIATSLPPVGSVTAADIGLPQTAQLGLQRPTFQSNLPPYQPVGNLGSWGTSHPPPSADGSGLAMPMFWQGYYAPPGGLPHLQQPPLLQPLSGLPLPHSMQQPLQYAGLNASASNGSSNIPDFSYPFLPPASNTQSLTSSSLQSTLAPNQATVLAPETSKYLTPSQLPVNSFPTSNLGANFPTVPSSTSEVDSIANMSRSMPSAASSNLRMVSAPNVGYQAASQRTLSAVGPYSSSQIETSVALITPGQLLQPGPPVLPLSQPSQTSNTSADIKPTEVNDKTTLPGRHMHASPETKEPILPLPAPSGEKSTHASSETKEPILPLPAPTGQKSAHASPETNEPILPLPTPIGQKMNGAASHIHHHNRGGGRGRGRVNARPVTKFNEDFDFTAMNEKFKKDEVWGHLGKSKAHSNTEGDAEEDGDGDVNLEEYYSEPPKIETKPVYVKDDFFDSLSCNANDRGTWNGNKFSEQRKVDTETFGDFPRHRMGGWGGRGFRGGGGRGRGSFYGRGYGYTGRGRVYSPPNRASQG